MTTLDDNNFIDPSTVSVMPVAQKYGLIGGGALIILGLVLYLAGLTDYSGNTSNTIPSILQYIVMGGVLFFAMKEHRDNQLNGYMTYGRALGVGTLTGVFTSILVGIWAYVFFAYISPELIDQMRTVAEERMAEKGLEEEKLEAALAMSKKIMTPIGMAVMTAFGSALFMFILSLIISIFTKRDAPRV